MSGRTERKPRRVLAGSALTLGGLLAVLGFAGACGRRSEPAATEAAETRTVLIPVDGMSCAACVARVKKALASIEGVSNVEVSLVERRARVRFAAGRVRPDQLVAAINALGYRAGAPVEGE